MSLEASHFKKTKFNWIKHFLPTLNAAFFRVSFFSSLLVSIIKRITLCKWEAFEHTFMWIPKNVQQQWHHMRPHTNTSNIIAPLNYLYCSRAVAAKIKSNKKKKEKKKGKIKWKMKNPDMCIKGTYEMYINTCTTSYMNARYAG